MRGRSKERLVVLAALSVLATTAPGQNPRPGPATNRCGSDQVMIGDLGYGALSCSNCTQYLNREDPSRNRWEFRSEPVITQVRPGGPADGKLQSGDAIVAIDGHLITTREGGRRFARVEPGEAVEVTVRRAGREVAVTIVPGAECPPPAPPDAPVVAAPPTAPGGVPQVPEPPRPPVSPPVPDLMPSGWIGFSISCSDCGIHVVRDSGSVWWFANPPIIESVERGSPAHTAGIRGGDRLTHIDGIVITTEAGGRRFGAIRPGDRVGFQIDRDGRTVEASLVAGERESGPPTADQAPSPPRPPSPSSGLARVPRPDVVRFTGLVGTALIEVKGGPITVTETEDEVVIQSSDITVRIRRAKEQGGSD